MSGEGLGEGSWVVGEGRREGVGSSPVVAEAEGVVGVLGIDVVDEQVPSGARVGDGDGMEPRIEGRAVAMVERSWFDRAPLLCFRFCFCGLCGLRLSRPFAAAAKIRNSKVVSTTPTPTA